MKIILLLILSIISCSAYTQNNDKYTLQRQSSQVEYQQYVGKRVKVLSGRYGDKYTFVQQYDGRINTIYTIQKIKYGNPLSIYLKDSDGKTTKVLVTNGKGKEKYVSSLRIFFLCDEFEKDKNSLLEKIVNCNDEEVANISDIIPELKNGSIIVKYKIQYAGKEHIVEKKDLQFFKNIGSAVKNTEGLIVGQISEIGFKGERAYYCITSSENSMRFLCWPEDVNKYFGDFGIILKHPLIKESYRVCSIINLNENEPSQDKNVRYITKGMLNGDTRSFNFGNKFEVWKDDLAINYVFQLSKVEKPSNPTIKYGKTKTIKEADKNITKYSYIDNNISILIYGTEEGFYFRLKNVSQFTQKLIWDEAVYVDFDNCMSRVIHNGIKFVDRESSQPTSTIIKGAYLEDEAIPTSSIYYDNTKSDWQIKSLFPQTPNLKGLKVRLMLPIKIKNVTNEYIFEFDLNYKYLHPERLISYDNGEQ